MKDFCIDKLKEETSKAIEEGQILKAVKEAEDLKKETIRDKQSRLWAEQKVLNVPSLAMEAAKKGKNKIKVADTRKDYSAVIGTDKNSDNFYTWNIKGDGLKFKYLNDLLIEMGFNVQVTYQHDGVGIESWYDVDAIW